MKFLLFLSFLPGFLVALTVHEAAHALASKWLGDCYAQKQGRVSLNPMRHLSALGTLMLFVLGFGWGKPVPVNLYNYKHPKLYYLLSSLAGPFSNILLCFVSLGLIYGLNFVCQTEQGRTSLSQAGFMAYMITWWFLYSLLYINVVLAVINLMPIPPLDGSKIWPCLIPGLRPSYSGKMMWIWIILVIVLMQGDTLGRVIDPAIGFVQRLMPQMLVKQVVMPTDFPPEMQAPSDALGVHYTKTNNAAGEPNLFAAVFVHKLLASVGDYQTRIIGKMGNLAWSYNGDPNNIEFHKMIIDEEAVLFWSGIWDKGNRRFCVDIQYYSDPNNPDSDKWLSVEYKYAIYNPDIPQ